MENEVIGGRNFDASPVLIPGCGSAREPRRHDTVQLAMDHQHRPRDRREVDSGGFGSVQPGGGQLEEQHAAGFADQSSEDVASNLLGLGVGRDLPT
jgi:hypothetical protein